VGYDCEESAMRFRTTTQVLPGEHFIVATALRGELIRPRNLLN
jgi:hypothetical protein